MMVYRIRFVEGAGYHIDEGEVIRETRKSYHVRWRACAFDGERRYLKTDDGVFTTRAAALQATLGDAMRAASFHEAELDRARKKIEMLQREGLQA